ncbi:hypothetical protein [Asanoa siamensis]|uniref:Uncharacterized protein n=1 Tax=Asanoa siamensis TaxID=926357 RepID=A0ABQ4CY75_9ACTN|nr:hypothetical protein [Asanoa siamensis]GIF76249.1 hypothetical protein Asi02nite_57670 [Asanoa siamensis]
MSDIRQLLETAKGDPPPPADTVDDIIRAGRRRLRRSRTGTFGGAGLGLVAVAATLLVATSGTPADRPTEVPLETATTAVPARPLTATFAGFRVGGFEVTDPLRIAPTYQQALVRRPGGEGAPDVGVLTVYAAGVFRPDRFRAGAPLEMNGRPGWAAMVDRTIVYGTPGTRKTTTKVIPLPALAWQYAEDAWATLESNDDDAKQGLPAVSLRRIVDAFAPGGARPATAPVKAGYVPNGWTVAAVGRNLTTGDSLLAETIWVPADTGFDSLAAPLDLTGAGLPAIAVRISPVDREGPYRHPVNPPCPVGEHFCDVPIDGRFYAEVHDMSGTLSAAELTEMTKGLRFATVARPETWFPVPSN